MTCFFTQSHFLCRVLENTSKAICFSMKFPVLFTLALATLTSCDPDGYPNTEDLVGTWVERAPYTDTLVFKSNRSLIRYRNSVVDTLLFRTNGEKGTVTISNPNSVSEGENEYDVLMSDGYGMILVDYRTTSTTNADGIFDRQ